MSCAGKSSLVFGLAAILACCLAFFVCAGEVLAEEANVEKTENVSDGEGFEEEEQKKETEEQKEPEQKDDTEQSKVSDTDEETLQPEPTRSVPGNSDDSENVKSGSLLGATASATVLTDTDLTNIMNRVWQRTSFNWYSLDETTQYNILQFLVSRGSVRFKNSLGENVVYPTLWQAAYDAKQNAYDALHYAQSADLKADGLAAGQSTLQSDMTQVKSDVATIKADITSIGTTGNVTINTDQMDKFVSALKTLNTQTLLLLIMLSIVGGLVAWRIVAERWRNG